MAWQRSEPKIEEIIFNHQVLLTDVRMAKDHTPLKADQTKIDSEIMQWRNPFQ